MAQRLRCTRQDHRKVYAYARVPDVIPGITPTVDVQLAFGTGEGFTDHKSNGGDVLVGAFVPPAASVQPPKVDVNVFHTEEKKYTLAIVDPINQMKNCNRTELPSSLSRPISPSLQLLAPRSI